MTLPAATDMIELTHTALIVEGGAMRSVFSAGLLDGFLAEQFNPFDFYIGISAGAFNLAAYMAGTPGTSLQIYRDLALDKRFICYSRFLRGGHLLDLDWLIETALARALLNLEMVYRHNKPLFVCVTDVGSGDAVYINITSQNLEKVLKASSALPLIYRGFPEIHGSRMTDGGVADGLPVAEAIRRGAKHIMVVRSRHKTYLKEDTVGHRFIRWKMRKHPQLTATMRERVKRHEDVIHLIRNPPAGIEILEVCPPEQFDLGRFNRKRHDLQQGYNIGLNLAPDVIQQWSQNDKSSP